MKLIMLSSAIIINTVTYFELSSQQSLTIFRKKQVQIQLEMLSPILHSLQINLGREVAALPLLILTGSLLAPLILLVMVNHPLRPMEQG